MLLFWMNLLESVTYCLFARDAFPAALQKLFNGKGAKKR
jgi:hypothetical protein